MVDRERYPAGVPCWVDTAQPDPDAAMDFYRGLFGWEFDDLLPAGSPGRYLVGHLDGRDVGAIGWSAEEPDRPPAWSTYVAVDDVERTAIGVLENGGEVLLPAGDMGDAGRMAVFSDNVGAVFCAWQAGAFTGAEAVNEPGTWNWSTLLSSDPPAAARFYGAVFGWMPTVVEFGEVRSAFWRLPGYGDFLATIDPDIHARHDQAGLPVGFSDAVAWLSALGDETGPGPAYPHWAVTFAVADTPAAADRVVELGGKVVVEPREFGPAVEAMVADPAGALFTLSAYTG